MARKWRTSTCTRSPGSFWVCCRRPGPTALPGTCADGIHGLAGRGPAGGVGPVQGGGIAQCSVLVDAAVDARAAGGSFAHRPLDGERSGHGGVPAVCRVGVQGRVDADCGQRGALPVAQHGGHCRCIHRVGPGQGKGEATGFAAVHVQQRGSTTQRHRAFGGLRLARQQRLQRCALGPQLAPVEGGITSSQRQQTQGCERPEAPHRAIEGE